MRLRKQDASGDMTFGHGQADFWNNQAAGVAQAAGTRLKLFTGEWFLDITAGMPWLTAVIGTGTESTRDSAVRDRILGTPGLLDIKSYASQYDGVSRSFSVQVDIDTMYGPATIDTTIPVP